MGTMCQATPQLSRLVPSIEVKNIVTSAGLGEESAQLMTRLL